MKLMNVRTGAVLLAVLCFACEDATVQSGAGGSSVASTDSAITEWSVAPGTPDIYEEIFGDVDSSSPTMFDAPTTGEPIVASWAKVLAPADLVAISEVSEARVVFGPSASEAVRKLGAMEIISSTDLDNLFLRRVLRVEAMADGSTIVHTEDAAVTDAVIHGTFGLGDDQPRVPTPGTGLLTQEQQLEFGGYDNRRGAKQKQFKVQLDGGALSIEGEFPFGGAALVPSMKVSVSQEPVVDTGFNATIKMTGEQKMCDLLQKSDTAHEYRTGWLNQNVERIPPEMRKMMWAVHWGGNARTGNATIDKRSGTDTHLTYNGYIETHNTFSSNTRRATRPVQMRPEFVKALESFEARIVREDLQEHFIIGGPYLRQPADVATQSREEILNYYRSMIPSLDPDVKETMRRYLGILETQGDDLQWLSTSLAVARDHCRGVSEQTNAAFVIKTAVSVEGAVELKTDRDYGNERLSVNGFNKNAVTGGYRKNLFGEKYLTTFWLFPGGFPVAVSPTFTLAAVVSPPKIEGAYKMTYGPYELVLEAGYNKSSSGGSGNAMDGKRCEGTVNGLCGGLFPELSAGKINFTSREARFTATTGVQLVPEFLLKFYGVAGIGAATPLYSDLKAEAIASVDLGVQDVKATGSLCLSTRTGLKVNLLGRLDNPFKVKDKTPLGEIIVPLYDSCSPGGGFIPCLKASAGFKAGASANGGVTYANPVFNIGEDGCPASTFTVEASWDAPQDVDLYIEEPNGGFLDRNKNSKIGGTRDISNGCTILPDDASRCTREAAPYKEVSTYGKVLGAVLPGEYTFYVLNASRKEPVSGTIKATYVDPSGQKTEQTFNFSVNEGNNYRSSSFSMTVPE